MNLKKWLSVILMGGLVVALSAPSALAWTNRPFGGHNANFRGGAPHGPAYGWHGQRPQGTTATPTVGSTATRGITAPPMARIIGVLGDSSMDTGNSITLTWAAPTVPVINTPMQPTCWTASLRPVSRCVQAGHFLSLPGFSTRTRLEPCRSGPWPQAGKGKRIQPFASLPLWTTNVVIKRLLPRLSRKGGISHKPIDSGNDDKEKSSA